MTNYEDPLPRQRRGDRAAWATVTAVASVIGFMLAGVALFASSQGDGAAPLPPGPVITAGLSTTPFSTSSPAASAAPSITLPATQSSTATMTATTTATTTAAPTTTTTADAPATHRASPTPVPAPTTALVRHQSAAPNTMRAGEISIPVQGVTAPIVGACSVHDGAMDPPSDVHQACSWKRGDVEVLTTHVSYVGQGQGSFAGLAFLHASDRVYTTDRGGHLTIWAVHDVTAYAKTALPQSVFLSTLNGGPTLRLVTCGGELDQSTGHYRDSVVATLIPVEG